MPETGRNVCAAARGLPPLTADLRLHHQA